MAISSLGVGSSILTQDVLDQLRAADDAQRIRPITLSLANENDKKNSLELLDSTMTNFRDAINEMKSPLLYNERKSTVSGTSVEMSVSANSDIQDFILDVTQLATKRIEMSGTFSNVDGSYDPKVDTIATGTGVLQFNITGAETIDIAVDDTTTLDDLKNAINDQAGDYAQATIVQTATGEFSLFISSVETGAGIDMSMSDGLGVLKGTELTTGMNVIAGSEGQGAEFTYNGQLITRDSNNIDDLISGYDITLKEIGTSEVKVEQNRDEIMKRIDSFVSKYNSIITELGKQTKASTDSSERGIFSAESSIKSMKRSIQDMFTSAGGGVASMHDFGFDVDRDGKMTVDKTIITEQLDNNPKNLESFFSGGDFTKTDNSVVPVNGVFSGFFDIVNEYAKTSGSLDLIKDSLTDAIKSLEDKKESATERLETKYEIMKKQFAAYDLIINRINSASSMFVQMANAQTAAQNN